VQLAGQRGGEIEAEAVHAHLRDPVAEAVHDQLQRARGADVDGVARARVVHVVARVAGHEAVVGGVVDPAVGDGGAEVVALRGVVVDDVQDDLDARLVQRVHHVPELVHLLAHPPAARVTDVGGEEADGVVAPVIGEALALQHAVGDELVDRHQLDAGDAEAAEVFDDRRRDESGIGAAQVFRHLGVAERESLDVELVDRRPRPRVAALARVRHRPRLVDHHRLGDGGGAVAVVAGQVGVGVTEGVAEDELVPAHVAVDGPGIGIDQQLGRIEAMASVRFVGTVDAVAVALAGRDPGNVDVPHQVGLLCNADPGQLVITFGTFEKAELDAGRVLGEQGEVHSLAVPGGAKGVGAARPGLHWVGENEVRREIGRHRSVDIIWTRIYSFLVNVSIDKPRRNAIPGVMNGRFVA
jgi:hypothetical protein